MRTLSSVLPLFVALIVSSTLTSCFERGSHSTEPQSSATKATEFPCPFFGAKRPLQQARALIDKLGTTIKEYNKDAGLKTDREGMGAD